MGSENLYFPGQIGSGAHGTCSFRTPRLTQVAQTTLNTVLSPANVRGSPVHSHLFEPSLGSELPGKLAVSEEDDSASGGTRTQSSLKQYILLPAS